MPAAAAGAGRRLADEGHRCGGSESAWPPAAARERRGYGGSSCRGTQGRGVVAAGAATEEGPAWWSGATA